MQISNPGAESGGGGGGGEGIISDSFSVPGAFKKTSLVLTSESN